MTSVEWSGMMVFGSLGGTISTEQPATNDRVMSRPIDIFVSIAHTFLYVREVDPKTLTRFVAAVSLLDYKFDNVR